MGILPMSNGISEKQKQKALEKTIYCERFKCSLTKEACVKQQLESEDSQCVDCKAGVGQFDGKLDVVSKKDFKICIKCDEKFYRSEKETKKAWDKRVACSSSCSAKIGMDKRKKNKETSDSEKRQQIKEVKSDLEKECLERWEYTEKLLSLTLGTNQNKTVFNSKQVMEIIEFNFKTAFEFGYEAGKESVSNG